MSICTCVDVEVGTHARAIAVRNPFTGRLVDVDCCVVPWVVELWEQGVETRASCCGHGRYRPSVIVAPGYVDRMRELGYEVDAERSDAVSVLWLLPDTILPERMLP